MMGNGDVRPLVSPLTARAVWPSSRHWTLPAATSFPPGSYGSSRPRVGHDWCRWSGFRDADFGPRIFKRFESLDFPMGSLDDWTYLWRGVFGRFKDRISKSIGFPDGLEFKSGYVHWLSGNGWAKDMVLWTVCWLNWAWAHFGHLWTFFFWVTAWPNGRWAKCGNSQWLHRYGG